ncbi:sensor histidine kinase [Dietzia maris]|uniref:histidine kinase n=1 Tax=Dietzia maris TaxID=37915 RepID=A0A365P9W2_9ACTN|nr:sensor histidine kinase [Dietzia maris]
MTKPVSRRSSTANGPCPSSTRTERPSGGSGIGLTITRALVEAHGGNIRAHSDGPGRDASFTVEFPSSGRSPTNRAGISGAQVAGPGLI